MKVKWLHLSDLHFIANDYESKELRKRLLKYLEKMNINCNFVAITGDIFYQYKHDDKKYIVEMSEFILELIKKVNVDIQNLFIVPGNHDVDRDDFDRKTLIKAVKSEEDQFGEMNKIPDNKITDLLANHKHFVRLLETLKVEGFSLFDKVHYVIERENYNILNLNTCLSYIEKFQEDLLICQSKLPDEIDNWDNSRKLNIAIGHHGMDMLEKTQREKLTHKLSDSGIDIYLCGHVHKPDFDTIYDVNDINIFVSGSNFKDEYSIPSFIFSEVDLETCQGYAELHVCDRDEDFWRIAYTRKFIEGKREFTINRLKKKTESLKLQAKEETAATSDKVSYNARQGDKVLNIIPIYNDNINGTKSQKNDFETSILTNRMIDIDWNSIDPMKKVESNEFEDINEFFLKYTGLYQKVAFNIIEDHNELYKKDVDFKRLLILGNRVLRMLQENPNYDLDFDVMSKIQIINDSKGKKYSSEVIYRFICFVSNWIRYLSELLYVTDQKETINESAIKLSLIKRNNAEDRSARRDEFEKSCFITISNINMYENSKLLPEEKYEEIIEKGLITLIYSIYVNTDKIVEKTKNITVEHVRNDEVLILLRMITDEQRKLMRNFIGREEYIKEIYDNITDNNFVVLHGREQSGKSSLLAKVVEKIRKERENQNKFVGEIVNSAPWITAVLYHSGNQSRDTSEMMKSIISQANTRLIDKVNVKRISSISNVSCRRIIQEILSKLVAECGNAILILDGIDSLINNTNDLSFLPEYIPEKASIVISLRSDFENLKWLKEQRSVKLIELKEITRSEIPSFTKIVDDDNGGEGKKFNDDVWKKFSNRPGKIIEICNEIMLKNGDYSLIRLDTDENELFLEACEKWTGCNYEDKNVSQEMLVLLALFSPICSLDIELIQKYFINKNKNYKLPYFRRLLANVRNQVEGIDSYKVKLTSRAFSEYVVNFYFSKIDLQEYIDEIFIWFSNDKDIPVKLICQFIQHWRDAKRVKSEYLLSKVDNFLSELKNKNEKEILFNISNTIINDGMKMEDVAVKCLDICLLLDDIPIKITYALRLIEGKGLTVNVEKGESILKELVSNNVPEALFALGRRLLLEERSDENVSKGKEYLLKAAELGFMNAKAFVGGILLDGDIFEKNQEVAFKYLEDAVGAGNVWAKIILGDALIFRSSSIQDIERGEKLLREACNLGNQKAKEVLAKRLISGYGLKQDLLEGERLLKDLIKEGSLDAMVILANRLLDGEGLKQNIDEGRELLNKAYTQGNIEAKRILANRLLDGRGFERDIKKGEAILRDLANSNDYDAMLNLANRLLDGASLEMNQHEGENLLRGLVDKKYTDAKINYSDRLIENDGVIRDIKLGEKIIREVALLGNESANIKLALRLVYGDGLEKNLKEGEYILRKLCNDGSIKAQMELGIIIVEGKCNEEFDGEGEYLLRKAASSGYFDAKFRLAMKLISDERIKRNVVEAEQILIELTKYGYVKAGVYLGNKLLDGEIFRKNSKYGEELLRKFSDNGYAISKYYLGLRLIKGDGLSKNIEEGVDLLREVISMGFAQAKYALGEKLIDGDGIEKNIAEGRSLLYEAMNSGVDDAKLSISLRLLDGNGYDKDKKSGEALLRECINDGNERAKIILANRLIHGIGVDKNSYEGIGLLNNLISEGNKRAKHILAVTLIDGDDVPVDSKKGESLLRESAKDGYIQSKVEIASRLIDGRGINKNIEEAINVFEGLVQENNKEGKCTYAKRLIGEYSEIKNLEKGINLLKELALEDYEEAKFLLACELLDGNDVIYDEKEGERILREVSDGNYKAARLNLAIRLINGDKLQYNFIEGEKILKELMKEGNITAVINLGKAFLVDICGNRNIEEGLKIFNEIIEKQNIDIENKYSKEEYAHIHETLYEYYFSLSNIESELKGVKHLKEAVRLESPEAICELGIRYLDGRGVSRSISKGQKKLSKALNLESLYAKYEIGRRHKYGIKYKHDQKTGDKYINEVLNDANGSELRDIAFEYYKRKGFEAATFLLDKAFAKGSRMAGNDLAYMLRRNEAIGHVNIKNIDALLEQGVKYNEPVSIINYALCYACGYQKELDWHKADEIISMSNNLNSGASWWYEIALQNDAEGDLVIGMLVRHNLITDPDSMSIKQRMDKAREAGWKIPNWMNEIIT